MLFHNWDIYICVCICVYVYVYIGTSATFLYLVDGIFLLSFILLDYIHETLDVFLIPLCVFFNQRQACRAHSEALPPHTRKRNNWNCDAFCHIHSFSTATLPSVIHSARFHPCFRRSLINCMPKSATSLSRKQRWRFAAVCPKKNSWEKLIWTWAGCHASNVRVVFVCWIFFCVYV